MKWNKMLEGKLPLLQTMSSVVCVEKYYQKVKSCMEVGGQQFENVLWNKVDLHRKYRLNQEGSAHDKSPKTTAMLRLEIKYTVCI